MPEKVEYELSLKDLFTEQLKKVEEATKTFDEVLEKVKDRAKNLGLDVSFMEPLDFIKEGIEKVHQLHDAHQGLADAMLAAGHYSSEAFDKMTAGAAEFAEHINYNEQDVVKLQTQLMQTGDIGATQMDKLTEAGADVATKLNMSLADAGKLLTDAMKDPEAANSLGTQLKIDPEVMAGIQKLTSEGKGAEAQMKLLDAVQQKVGGSAKDAFNSNPIAQFNKVVEGVQTVFSEAAVSILEYLKPALDWLKEKLSSTGGLVKKLSTWMAEHSGIAKALGVVIAGVAGAIAGYTLVAKGAEIATKAMAVWQKIQNGYTLVATAFEMARAEGMGVLTAAQWALNIAMEANPIGLIVAALAALGAAIFYAYEKSETFHAGLWGLWGGIKAFAGVVQDIFTGLYHTIHGVFTLNPDEIGSGFSQMTDAVHDAAKRIGDGAKEGYEEGLKDFNKKKDEKITPHSAAPTTPEGTVTTGTGGKAQLPAPSKASGSKSVTINIAINKQIETLNIKTSNLVESASRIQEKVAEALTNAVNQSQIIAGGR